MDQNTNKTKKYVIISLSVMFIGSLLLGWIMASNYQTDDSKVRHKLTKIYKEIKDQKYVYDQNNGVRIFQTSCMKCHGHDGAGNSIYPPLRGSKVITDSPQKAFKIILHGLYGPITRSGKTYNSTMPGSNFLNHQQLADVLNYIRRNFNKNDSDISHVEAIKVKIDTLSHKRAYQESEL